VSFLTTRGEADPERIGALGICASGGYVLCATASDHRIKAVGTVSAVDIARHFPVRRRRHPGPAVFQGLLEIAARARTAQARGEQPDPPNLALFPGTIEEARARGGEYGAEGFECYPTPRAQHPRSASFLTWTSIDKMATFDAWASVPLIGPRPLLMVVGTRAVTSWMSVEAFQRAVGPKEICWIDGASHNDLYDKKQYVDPAVERLTGFFARNLNQAA
jgi:fermentation-respiration switch protein FrsA (DUF1100 family)